MWDSVLLLFVFFVFKQKTAYEMRISDWSSDVCSSDLTSIAVQTATGKEILFRQIAGAMARRIVWYVAEGSAVTQGEEFGFIKFGSRVDVFLPLGTKEIGRASCRARVCQ